MRTGIYVQKPTTVTIRASAPGDARVQLRQFRVMTARADMRAAPCEPVAVGTHQLDPGIYLIVSSKSMQIEGDGVTTQIVANDKDPWPEIAAPVVGLVLDATKASVQDFFAVTKGIEVDDAPQESTEPITKITDDPDGI
jgi:hypothetical protein